MSIFMVAEDNSYTLLYVRSHVRVAFGSEATHQRDGPGGYLGSDCLYSWMEIYSSIYIPQRLLYSSVYVSIHY